MGIWWMGVGSPNGPRSFDPFRIADQLTALGLHELQQQTAEASRQAVESLSRAVALDPQSARAYAALAKAYRERDTWAGIGTAKEVNTLSTEDIAENEEASSTSDAFSDNDAREEQIELNNDTVDTLVNDSQEVSDEGIDDGENRG